MKLVFDKTQTGTRVDLRFSEDRESPSWGVLSLDTRTHVLQGVIGDRPAGGISNLKPVKMVNEVITPSTIEAFAALALAQVAGNAIIAEQEAKVDPSRREQDLSVFDAFLSRGAAPAGGATAATQRVDPRIELPRPELNKLTGYLREMPNDGGRVPLRPRFITIGAAMPGLKAFSLQRATSARFPALAVPQIELPAAVQALSATSRPSSNAVTYYGGYKLPADLDEDEVKRNRAQAAASYPAFAGMIADSPAMSKAVDAGEPIQPLLSERTGLGKAALKRMSKITTPMPAGPVFETRQDMHGEDALGVDRQRRFATTARVEFTDSLRHLAAMPPDRTPQDDAAWLRYNDILAGCAIPLHNAFGIPVSDVLMAAKGDWVRFHETLARAADFDPAQFDRATIALTTMDAIEVVDSLARQALLPQIFKSIESTARELPEIAQEWVDRAFQASFAIVSGSAKNIAGDLFATARRYSSRIPALMTATGDPVPDVTAAEAWTDETFPILTGEYVAANGLVIRPLRDHAMMREESRRLGHCVGYAYLHAAKQASSHIFSVQSADGETSHSTIELSGIRGDGLAEILSNLRTVQHRAQNNSTPEDDAREAAREFTAGLKSGAIPINADEIVAYREALRLQREARQAGPVRRQAIRFTWTGALEFEWENEDKRAAVWDEWKDILGGAWARGETPEVLFRAKQARDLLTAMDPEAAMILAERAAAARAAEQEAQAAEPEELPEP